MSDGTQAAAYFCNPHFALWSSLTRFSLTAFHSSGSRRSRECRATQRSRWVTCPRPPRYPALTLAPHDRPSRAPMGNADAIGPRPSIALTEAQGHLQTLAETWLPRCIMMRHSKLQVTGFARLEPKRTLATQSGTWMIASTSRVPRHSGLWHWMSISSAPSMSSTMSLSKCRTVLSNLYGHARAKRWRAPVQRQIEDRHSFCSPQRLDLGVRNVAPDARPRRLVRGGLSRSQHECCACRWRITAVCTAASALR